jgi:Fuc2NAc and GlcNAc transferase
MGSKCRGKQLNNSLFVVIGLGLFLASVVLIRLFCYYAVKRGLVAIPNARSSHQKATPQGAGVVFVLLWLACLLVGYLCRLFSLMDLVLFFPATLLVSLVGFWDDYKELAARKRFVAQLLAATFCVALLGDDPTLHLSRYTTVGAGWVGLILTTLSIVWSTNLYNFMDGLDGLTAIESLYVFGIGGFFFWTVGATPLALLSWVIVVTVAGFLVWNWPRARVFMGDAGSYFLGFLVGLFSLIGDRLYHIPITVWIILYGVFWFDTTVTLIRRFLRRENLAMAHREHAFHRLHRAGYSHAQVLWGVIVLNTLLAGIAIWALKTDSFKWGFGLTLFLLISVYWKIEKLKPMTKTA